MRRALAWVTILAVSNGAHAAAPDPVALEASWKKAFDAHIQQLKKRFSGRISVYMSDFTLGAKYTHDIEEPCYLASGIKIAFMHEVFRQEHLGLLKLDEELVYDEAHVRDGAPRLNKQPLDTKWTIAQLLELMIHASDNSASDILLDRVGTENVNKGLLESGFTGFGRVTHLVDVRRGYYREVDILADELSGREIREVRWTRIWDPQIRKFEESVGKPRGSITRQEYLDAYERYYATHSNSAKLDSVGALLEKIAKRELISEKASEAMYQLLLGVTTGEHRIRAELPKDTVVAHKTGSQYERICDLGLVTLPDSSMIVFTACLAGGQNRTRAEATLASLARQAYDLGVDARR